MLLDGFGEGVDVVAAFEEAHAAAFTVLGRGSQDELCELRKVLGFETERADRIQSVCVKASADQDELGSTL